MVASPEAIHRELPTLDGYRAIAALAVLTTHVAFNSGLVLEPIIGPITSRMDFGVCLFFVLSGFLLYRPWARHALRLGPSPLIRVYGLRRLLRILPAYLVMLVVTLLVLPEIQPVAREVWVHYLTLTHIYADIPPVEGLTHIWSLATEIAFYVALPLMAWLMGRAAKRSARTSFWWQIGVIAVLCGLALALQFQLGWNAGIDARAGLWLPAYLDWFGIGMVLGLVREARALPAPPRLVTTLDRLADEVPTCLLIAACIFAIVCTPIGGSLVPSGNTPIYATVGPWAPLFKHALYGLCAAALLLPGFLGSSLAGSWRKSLASPIPSYLGTISYGIFLWHLLILRLLLEFTNTPVFSGGFLWLWPATVALSVVVASLSWYVIERPAQQISHRYRPSRSHTPPAVPVRQSA